MNEHPEDSSKERSVDEALDEAKENYGEYINVDKLIAGLESRGWVFRG